MLLGISGSNCCLQSTLSVSPASLHADPSVFIPATSPSLALCPGPCVGRMSEASLVLLPLASWPRACEPSTLGLYYTGTFWPPAELTEPLNHPPCHAEKSPPIGQACARPLTPASPLSAHPAGAGTEWHLWRNPAEGLGPKLQRPLPPPVASPGGPATVGDC